MKIAVAEEDTVADGFNERVAPDAELEEVVMTTVKVMSRLLKPLRSFKVMMTVEPGVAVEGTSKKRVLSSTTVGSSIRVTKPK